MQDRGSGPPEPVRSPPARNLRARVPDRAELPAAFLHHPHVGVEVRGGRPQGCSLSFGNFAGPSPGIDGPYPASVSQDDSRYHQAVVKRMDRINLWLQRLDPVSGGPTVRSGSATESDDGIPAPYQMSHEAWRKLSSAVDHVNAARAPLAAAEPVLYPFAPYTLLRAALENASVTVWLLTPNEQEERVRRRLRLAADHIKNQERAKDLTGTVGPRTDRRTPHAARAAGQACRHSALVWPARTCSIGSPFRRLCGLAEPRSVGHG